MSSTGSIDINTMIESTNNTISSLPFTLAAGQSGHITLTTALSGNIMMSGIYTNTAQIIYSGVTYTGSASFTITPPVLSCTGLNAQLSLTTPLSNPSGFTTLNNQPVSYNLNITNTYAIPLEVVSVTPTWSTVIGVPTTTPTVPSVVMP